MVEPGSGQRRATVWWFAALILVPAALAAVTLLWPGPQLSADIGERATSALEGAGLGSITVAVTGRDVRLDAVPRGMEQEAAAAVADLPGVRAVRIGEAAQQPEPAPMGTAPTGALPTTPGGPAALSPAARQQLVDRVAAVLAANPITFGADSAELSGSAATAAAAVGRLLAAEPAAPVAVDGFVADTPGPAETAQRLSEQRATVVADALEAAGVERARITATGHGDTRPLATPAASRRVEITVT
ncbi:OmpA family protein [Pseudonocardia sp. GCM10023141]|uniref:OmpA family protein n=1 Tax=Pseudonocardia sp. GCM10023141 TaxID=3252653 RepID=UPI0036237234